MKRVTILTIVLAMIFAGNTHAQIEQGTIRGVAGLAVGTETAFDSDGEEKAGLGINIGGEYFFTDAISFAPSYTYFLKSTVGGLDVNFNLFNLDARYYFMTDGPEVYGLIGYSSTKITSKAGGESESETETGINIGAGAVIPINDAMGLNLQLKHHSFKPDGADDRESQFVFNAGVVFSF